MHKESLHSQQQSHRQSNVFKSVISSSQNQYSYKTTKDDVWRYDYNTNTKQKEFDTKELIIVNCLKNSNDKKK